MEPQAILERIDIWCQWDHAFGANAESLRAYFVAHPEELRALLLALMKGRYGGPTRKWRREWEALRQGIPPGIMRDFLVGLAGRREWFLGLAREQDRLVLEDGERCGEDHIFVDGREINFIGAQAYAGWNDEDQRWSKENGRWYERLPEKAGRKARAIRFAACWALVAYADAEARTLLTGLARQGMAAAIWALGQIGDDDAVARLECILACTRSTAIIKRAQQAFKGLASRTGLEIETLRDRAVLTHGLNAQGERLWDIEGYTVRLAATGAGRVQFGVRGPAGEWLRALPDEIQQRRAGQWAAVQAEKKALAITLKQQKKRLDMALSQERCWIYEEWERTFSTHPLMRGLAARLVWRVSPHPDAAIEYALWDSAVNSELGCGSNDETPWHNLAGEPIKLTTNSEVQLAHPACMSPEEHSAWQHLVLARKIKQPIKQIFRDVYVLTPAEEECRVYSKRFASQLVPYKRVEDMEHGSVWQGRNTGRIGACWRDFPLAKVRAYIWHTSYYQNRTIGRRLEQIAFYPLDHPTLVHRPKLALDPACIPLREISPVTFSETMRDINLQLVRYSLGNGEGWRDEAVNTDEQTLDPFSKAVTGMRADVLRELFAILELDERVSIEGTNALVYGDIYKYRVALNNGNVFLEPHNRYLCIVPRGEKERDLYLPFANKDATMAEIVSKILMLVNDGEITDKTILRQLQRN